MLNQKHYILYNDNDTYISPNKKHYFSEVTNPRQSSLTKKKTVY